MLILTFLYLFISGNYAIACDRPHLDLEFAAALADQIVIGKVTKIISSDQVVVNVVKELKGKKSEVINIKGVYTTQKSRFEPCQSAIASVGSNLIFFLSKKESGDQYQRTIDWNDGALEAIPKIQEKILHILENKGSSSNWKSFDNLFSIRLVSKKLRYKEIENIDLDLVFRNISSHAQDFKYRTWPPENHTFCDLEISSDGNLIKGEPVPIERSAIVDYFSKHGPKFDFKIEPMQTHHFYLDQINFAKPGWGYKERTGFKFYPLKQREYSISTRCHNFFKNSVQSDEIKIVVEK